MPTGWITWAGGALGLLLVAGLWWYGRRQLQRRAAAHDKCPRCGQDQWHRVHRSLPDHIFGIGLKVRRFRCANPSCQWEGLRKRSNG
jgi:hypothetical protein